MPEIPAEVWAIVNEGGGLVPPCDDDGTDAFMAWPTREQAEAGLRHQVEMGWLETGLIVRVK